MCLFYVKVQLIAFKTATGVKHIVKKILEIEFARLSSSFHKIIYSAPNVQKPKFILLVLIIWFRCVPTYNLTNIIILLEWSSLSVRFFKEF